MPFPFRPQENVGPAPCAGRPKTKGLEPPVKPASTCGRQVPAGRGGMQSHNVIIGVWGRAHYTWSGCRIWTGMTNENCRGGARIPQAGPITIYHVL
jgi:hypothetical protein